MKQLLTFALMNSLSVILYGQSDCISLLKQGIYNEISQITNYSDRSVATTDICSAYNQYKLDKNTASANAKYKTIFKGGASYSSEEIETIGKMYCEQNFSLDEAQKIVNSYSRYVDQGLVQSFVRCKEIEKDDNMKFSITPLNEYLGSVSISVEYRGVPSLAPTIGKTNYDDSKLTLSGSLLDGEGQLLNKVYDLRIVRKDIQTQSFETPAGHVLSEGTQLTINIQNKALTINFPPVYPKTPVVIRKGIGEIVASMLDEASFQALYNRDGEIWVLADQRLISENTGYGQYLKRQNSPLKAPDLRGVFLRGKQNDRDKGGNPDGNLPLGKESEDKTSKPDLNFVFEVTNNDHRHSHPFRVGQNEGNVNAGEDVMAWDLKGNRTKVSNVRGNVVEQNIAGHNIRINSGGDSETRPVNVTVNYFIRIN